MNFKSLLATGLFLCATHCAWAEGETTNGVKITQVYGEARMGYVNESVDGSVDDNRSGLKGQYWMLRMDGQFTDNVKFSYRQRFNKPNKDTSLFDATDWMNVDWQVTDRFSLNAGKQEVLIGGYEYDANPQNIYQASEFWMNVAPFQFGASATYKLTENDKLTAQVANSHLRSFSGNNTYAYSLFWAGSHGAWKTLWSVNQAQTAYETSATQMKKGWINYLSLGNEIDFTDNVYLWLDFMNRAGRGQDFLLKDWSVVAELSVKPTDAVRVFGKYTHDENKSGTPVDVLVTDGTSINSASAGIEYTPLKKNFSGLRLFASAGYSWGENTNPDGALRDKALNVMVGLKMKVGKY